MKRCSLAPVPQEFADLVLRADAHVVGALAARSDLPAALARYDATRLWTWAEMELGGLTLARAAALSGATILDVLLVAAGLFRAVPDYRAECGRCRECRRAEALASAARSYAFAVRAVWCTLTGRAER